MSGDHVGLSESRSPALLGIDFDIGPGEQDTRIESQALFVRETLPECRQDAGDFMDRLGWNDRPRTARVFSFG